MDWTQPPSRMSGQGTRAQSVFDYAIGASLFIVVVVGVIAFMPSAFSALNDDGGVSAGDRLIADRAAENLVESGFARTEDGRLKAHCVVAYFEGSGICGFESGQTPGIDAGIAERHPINVTIEADFRTLSNERERLCWDTDTDSLKRLGSTACADSSDVSLTAGSKAKENVNYVTVSRAATIGGREVYVLVRSW